MDLSSVKIAKYSGQRIWMVRAHEGKFLRHFKNGSVVTIGHLDKFYNHTESSTLDIPTDESIRGLILSNADFVDTKSKIRKFNGKGRNCFHQISHFINDIKKGDIVVSLDNTKVMIGVCQSTKAHFSSRPIASSADPKELSTVKLKHRLRKKVEWGPTIQRDKISGLLKETFQSRHTVTNLTDHWKDVFGLLYPFFSDEKNLYFSTHIGTRADINGKIISRFFDNLSSAQLVAEKLMLGVITDDFIDRILNDEIDWDEFDLTAKAFFKSPGDVFNKIPLPKGSDEGFSLKVLALVLLLLSGQSNADDAAQQLDPSGNSALLYTPSDMIDERYLPRNGADNVDRLLGELARKNSQRLERMKKAQKTAKIKTKLKLSIPSHETSSLEGKAGIKVTRISSNEE
ncbi:hypothetical protein [Pseudomonas sp. P9_31]|uniref:hypothetical protein n=1 Tax=Pseudomonas sp. P9_31 TaxID=3043448 RepID=UPI002A365A1E|nr:hypothetical protein [Pseudomonas sp. P9_31]WPN57271.1 hypothetical protein QMK51_24595 [Pseudomonas sp. P9_31]